MDLFHKIMALVDKNSENIPEGDYLQLCNTIQELREHVKPPSFLDQTIPMWVSDETSQGPPVFHPTHDILNGPIPDGQPRDWMDDELPSDPDTAAQRDREQFHQQWREHIHNREEDEDGDPSGYADTLIGHRPYPGTATHRDREELDDDEERENPGLNQFLHELHEEWSDPVEPGAYYPPPRQAMHQDVVPMEVD